MPNISGTQNGLKFKEKFCIKIENLAQNNEP